MFNHTNTKPNLISTKPNFENRGNLAPLSTMNNSFIKTPEQLKFEKRQKLDDAQYGINRLQSLFYFAGEVGILTKDKNIQTISSGGKSVASGAMQGAFLTGGHPVGALIGGAIGLGTFLFNREKQKNNAKKDDPFAKYLQENFVAINQGLNTINDNLITISRDQNEKLYEIREQLSYQIKYIAEGFREQYIQNNTNTTLINNNIARVDENVNRVHDLTHIMFEEIMDDKCKSAWDNLDNLLRQSGTGLDRELYVKIVSIVKKQGLASQSAFTGKAEFKALYDKSENVKSASTEQFFRNPDNTLKSFYYLMNLLDGEWRAFESSAENNYDGLCNPRIWLEGTNHYISMMDRFPDVLSKYDREYDDLTSIIESGAMLINFLELLNDIGPSKFLSMYLRDVEELENYLADKYIEITGKYETGEEKTESILQFKNAIRTPTNSSDPQLNTLCNKVDASLNLFITTLRILTFTREQINSLNIGRLKNTNQIINSIIQNNFDRGFPDFHSKLVEDIYNNSIGGILLTINKNSKKQLEGCNQKFLNAVKFNVSMLKTKLFYECHNLNEVNISKIDTNNINQVGIKSGRAHSIKPSQLLLKDQIEIQTQKNKLKLIFKNYYDHAKRWLGIYKPSDEKYSDSRYFKEIQRICSEDETKDTDQYRSLNKELVTGRELYLIVKREMDDQKTDIVESSAHFIKLNESIRYLHGQFKDYLASEYKITEKEVEFLDKDEKELKEIHDELVSLKSEIKLEELITPSGNDLKPSRIHLETKQNKESIVSKESKEDQLDQFVSYLMGNETLKNKLLLQDASFVTDLANSSASNGTLSNDNTCYMNNLQRQIIFLFEVWKINNSFPDTIKLPLPTLIPWASEEYNLLLDFGNKGIVSLNEISLNSDRQFNEASKSELQKILTKVFSNQQENRPVFISLNLPDHFTTLVIQKINNSVRFRYIDSLNDENSRDEAYQQLNNHIQLLLREFFKNTSISEITTGYIKQQHLPGSAEHKKECGLHTTFNILHMMMTSPEEKISTMKEKLKLTTINASKNGGLDSQDALSLVPGYRDLLLKLKIQRDLNKLPDKTQQQSSWKSTSDIIAQMDKSLFDNYQYTRVQAIDNGMHASIRLTDTAVYNALATVDNYKHANFNVASKEEKQRALLYRNKSTLFSYLAQKREIAEGYTCGYMESVDGHFINSLDINSNRNIDEWNELFKAHKNHYQREISQYKASVRSFKNITEITKLDMLTAKKVLDDRAAEQAKAVEQERAAVLAAEAAARADAAKAEAKRIWKGRIERRR